MWQTRDTSEHSAGIWAVLILDSKIVTRANGEGKIYPVRYVNEFVVAPEPQMVNVNYR